MKKELGRYAKAAELPPVVDLARRVETTTSRPLRRAGASELVPFAALGNECLDVCIQRDLHDQSHAEIKREAPNELRPSVHLIPVVP